MLRGHFFAMVGEPEACVCSRGKPWGTSLAFRSGRVAVWRRETDGAEDACVVQRPGEGLRRPLARLRVEAHNAHSECLQAAPNSRSIIAEPNTHRETHAAYC